MAMTQERLVDFSEAAPKVWLAQMVKRGRKGPFGIIATLTPELATELLKHNEGNRAIKPGKVLDYAQIITQGRWEVNGEGLIISTEGHLNTGGHRCHAVIAAGIPIKTMFTFGVQRQTRTTTDSGAMKSAVDRLAMLGIPDPRIAAQAVGLLWQYKQFGHIPFAKGRKNRPSAPALDELAVAKQKTIAESWQAIPHKGYGKLCPAAVVTFAHVVLKAIDPAAATAFLTKLVEGAELTKRDPIFLARERLIADRLNREMQLRPRRMLEIIFRAWNAHRAGETPQFLRINGEWPQIHG